MKGLDAFEGHDGNCDMYGSWVEFLLRRLSLRVASGAVFSMGHVCYM